MTKDEVINRVVILTGIETADVKLIVTKLHEVIVKEVGNGKRIDFNGFGCYQPRVRKAKKARDILRNRIIDLPERVEPSFRPSKKGFTIKQKSDV